MILLKLCNFRRLFYILYKIVWGVLRLSIYIYYNDFIILQGFFLCRKYVVYVFYMDILFTSYNNLSKCSPQNTETHDLVATFLNLRIKRVAIKTKINEFSFVLFRKMCIHVSCVIWIPCLTYIIGLVAVTGIFMSEKTKVKENCTVKRKMSVCFPSSVTWGTFCVFCSCRWQPLSKLTQYI